MRNKQLLARVIVVLAVVMFLIALFIILWQITGIWYFALIIYGAFVGTAVIVKLLAEVVGFVLDNW